MFHVIILAITSISNNNEHINCIFWGKEIVLEQLNPLATITNKQNRIRCNYATNCPGLLFSCVNQREMTML